MYGASSRGSQPGTLIGAGRPGEFGNGLHDLGHARRVIVDDVVRAAGRRHRERAHGRAHRIVDMDQGQLSRIAADNGQPPFAHHVDHCDRRRRLQAIEHPVAKDDSFDRAAPGRLEHLGFHRPDSGRRLIVVRDDGRRTSGGEHGK